MTAEESDKQEPSISRSLSTEIDAVCDQYEAAWRAGREPTIEEYLRQLPESRQSGLLEELLCVELELRHTAGEQVTLPEYQSRFPAYKQQVEAAYARVAAGIESGKQSLDSTLRQPNALHIRCPHCHNPIELVDHNVLEQIACPSCGSELALAIDKTLDHQPGTVTETGRRTIGPFALIERLGVGGFGAVWKAHDTRLDRIVAVKIPRRSNIDRDETERFLREARTAARLQHPNIVSVHEVGLENDTIYIVSDFIEGTSLDKWLVDHHPTHRESAGLCVKIAKALHYAHEQGVIHRDLKPANIMLDTAGEPHIMDFGLAKREAAEITMTVEGDILGTPAYMSPEQAKGKGYSILFELARVQGESR